MLVGRLDRLDRLSDGSWELVDFKSGRSDPEALAHCRRQVGLYALAVHDVWKVPAEQIVAHLYYLQDGKDLAFTFDDAELGGVRAGAEVALESIARGDFPLATDRQLCQTCSYAHLCAQPGIDVFTGNTVL